MLEIVTVVLQKPAHNRDKKEWEVVGVIDGDAKPKEIAEFAENKLYKNPPLVSYGYEGGVIVFAGEHPNTHYFLKGLTYVVYKPES
jgi:hypothetical protein